MGHPLWHTFVWDAHIVHIGISVFCNVLTGYHRPMKMADTLVSSLNTDKAVAEAATAYQSGRPGQGNGRDDLVGAINQMFAEFELAYHNQFHKAYPSEGNVGLAKKYWFSQLQDFSAELLLRAARSIVRSESYLPTLSTMIRTCEQADVLFGLPSPRTAYVEACCAPEPKAKYAWSHPAVYFAALATGWFELASEPESHILPRFEYHYRKLCQRVAKGEDLKLPVQEALPEKVVQALAPEEQRQRLQSLRAQLDL